MYLGRVVEIAPDDRCAGRAIPTRRTLLDSTFEPDPKRRRIIAPLAGEMPSPFDLPAGLRLRGALPAGQRRSAGSRRPLLAPSGGGHPVACHHPDYPDGARSTGASGASWSTRGLHRADRRDLITRPTPSSRHATDEQAFRRPLLPAAPQAIEQRGDANTELAGFLDVGARRMAGRSSMC